MCPFTTIVTRGELKGPMKASKFTAHCKGCRVLVRDWALPEPF